MHFGVMSFNTEDTIRADELARTVEERGLGSVWFPERRLRGRKKPEAEEAIERLDRASDKGPEAAERFEKAARRILTVPKEAPDRRHQ